MASWLKVKAGRWPPRCSPKKGLLKSAPSTMKLLKMPRWPLMFSSSPSGPCDIDAPGVSRARFTKLRPSLGSASTTSSWMRCERVTSVVSITRGDLADDGHRLGRHDPQLHGQVEHPPDPQDSALDTLGAEPGGCRRHRQVVGAGRQQGTDERAGRTRLDRRQQVGVAVLDDDHGSRHRVAGRVVDGAADDAGSGPGLRRDLRHARADECGQEHGGGQAPHAVPRRGGPRLVKYSWCHGSHQCCQVCGRRGGALAPPAAHKCSHSGLHVALPHR